MGNGLEIYGEHWWENNGLETHILNYDKTRMHIWQTTAHGPSIDRFVDAGPHEWDKFLAATLCFAQHHNFFPPEITMFQTYIVKNNSQNNPNFTGERIECLFTVRPPIVHARQMVNAPTLGGTGENRKYSMYIHGGCLCIGINPAERRVEERHASEKVDVYWGKIPQKTIVRFTKSDIPNLIQAVYDNYCRNRGEIAKILSYFNSRVKPGE